MKALFASGMAGNAMVSAVEVLEREILGAPPTYRADAVTSRLAKRWTGRSLTPETARWLGRAARWAYGSSLAAAYGAVRPRRAPASLPRALALAGAIYLFEILAMPALGATPPLRRWKPAERWLLLLHTAAFSIATEALLGRPAKRRAGIRRPRG